MKNQTVAGNRLRSPTYSEARNYFISLNAAIAQSHKPRLEAFQEYLYSLEGQSFHSLARNQEVARQIDRLCTRLGVRVACPKCGAPSRLSCAPAGRTKHGSFLIHHPVNGRPSGHCGSTTLPRLTLVPAPPDRRRKG